MSIYLLFCGLCRFNRFRHCIGSIDTLQKKYGKKIHIKNTRFSWRYRVSNVSSHYKLLSLFDLRQGFTAELTQTRKAKIEQYWFYHEFGLNYSLPRNCLRICCSFMFSYSCSAKGSDYLSWLGYTTVNRILCVHTYWCTAMFCFILILLGLQNLMYSVKY